MQPGRLPEGRTRLLLDGWRASVYTDRKLLIFGERCTMAEQHDDHDSPWKGALRNAQEGVIEVLEVRFAEAPETAVEAVNSIEDMDILKDLHRKAITVGSLDEFEQILIECS